MTPQPRYTTPRTTSRPTAIGPAERIAELLGHPLMAHQRHAVELFTEKDGHGFYVFTDCTLVCPRQVGKSFTVLILLLLRCLGTPGSRCGYGAQDLKSARKMLLEEWVPLLEGSALKGTFKVRLQSGSESIRFDNGSIIELLVSTSTKAQHGAQWDFVVQDEAFALIDSRVETSVIPGMATRTGIAPGVQFMVVSTAGTRRRARICSSGSSRGASSSRSASLTRTAYIEWSAADGSTTTTPRPGTPATRPWHHHHRGRRALRTGHVGRGRVSPYPALPVDHRAARPGHPARTVGRPARPLEQAGRRTSPSPSTPPPTAGWGSIAIASRRPDGVVHVELVDRRNGVGWLAGEVARLARQHKAGEVVVDLSTPAKTALPALAEAGVKVTELRTGDVTAAFATFVSACADGGLAHIGQLELDAALNGAARRAVGDGSYAWTRRSSGVDISALCAVTFAHWAAATRSERRPQVHNLDEVVAQMQAEGRLPATPPPHLVFPRLASNPLGPTVSGPKPLPVMSQPERF